MLDEYIGEKNKENCQYLKNKRDKFFSFNANYRKKFKFGYVENSERQNLCSSLLFLKDKKFYIFFSLRGV